MIPGQAACSRQQDKRVERLNHEEHEGRAEADSIGHRSWRIAAPVCLFPLLLLPIFVFFVFFVFFVVQSLDLI